MLRVKADDLRWIPFCEWCHGDGFWSDYHGVQLDDGVDQHFRFWEHRDESLCRFISGKDLHFCPIVIKGEVEYAVSTGAGGGLETIVKVSIGYAGDRSTDIERMIVNAVAGLRESLNSDALWMESIGYSRLSLTMFSRQTSRGLLVIQRREHAITAVISGHAYKISGHAYKVEVNDLREGTALLERHLSRQFDELPPPIIDQLVQCDDRRVYKII